MSFGIDFKYVDVDVLFKIVSFKMKCYNKIVLKD